MMSTTTTTNTTWDGNVQKIYDEPVKTATITSPEGKKIVYVMTNVPYTKKKIGPIAFIARRQWGCVTCMRRAIHFANVTDCDGNHVFCRTCTDGPEAEIGRRISELKSVPCGILIIRSENVNGYELEEGEDEDGTPWEHYTMRYDKSPDPTLTPEDLDKYQKLSNRYLIIMIDLLSKFTHMTDMLKSVDMSIEIAEEASYGIKMLHSLKWFRNVIVHMIENYNGRCLNHMNRIEQFHVAAYATLTASPSEDFQGHCLPQYHQINNTFLNILGNSRTKEQMKKMIEAIFSPHTYQRPTVPVKNPGFYEAAAKAFGKFTVSMMAVNSDYEAMPCVHPVGKRYTPMETSDDVFSSLTRDLTQELGKMQDKYSSFASSATEDIPSITTVSELIKFASECDGMSLNHRYPNGPLNSVAVFKVDGINDGVLSTPYLWNFDTYNPYKILTHLSWNITHIHIISEATHNNVVFVLEDAASKMRTASSSTLNGYRHCFHPEFLSTKYKRVYNHAWNDLGKVADTFVTVPESEPVVAGVGSSKAKANGELMHPVNIQIRKGHLTRTVLITHW